MFKRNKHYKHLKIEIMSKTIFITGTSSGFGKLTAITLANAGHSVIAGMRNTKDKNATCCKRTFSTFKH